MTYSVDIDNRSKTIIINGHGRGTTADTLRLIADLHETLLSHPSYNLLYDSRKLDIESSPAEMMKVANALFRGDIVFGYFAVVVPPARELLGKVFAALANDRNVRVNVFDDLAEASRWIASRSADAHPTL